MNDILNGKYWGKSVADKNKSSMTKKKSTVLKMCSLTISYRKLNKCCDCAMTIVSWVFTIV